MHRQYPWLRLVGLTGFLLALMLFLTLVRPPFRVYSDPDLTSLVNAAYGARVQDAALHDLAHQRAQFQVTYSGGVCDNDALTHDGLVTAEVLACTTLGPARAVELWQGSPAHHAILSDPTFTTIGCASAAGVDGAWFYACLLTATEPLASQANPPTNEPLASQADTPGATPVAQPAQEPSVLQLPDTRMP